MQNSKTAREHRVRKLAARSGYMLTKSRVRSTNADNLGDYMLIDADTNCVVLGGRFDASLDDVTEFFRS